MTRYSRCAADIGCANAARKNWLKRFLRAVLEKTAKGCGTTKNNHQYAVFLKFCTLLQFSFSLPQYFPDRFVRKSLGKISVKCGNADCKWIGTVETLNQHQVVCAYTKTQCLLCQEWLAADEVSLPDSCWEKRLTFLSLPQVNTHRNVCVGVMTMCCFSELGCDHKLKVCLH